MSSSPDRPCSTSCTNAKVRQFLRRIEQHYDAEVAASGIRTTQYSLLSTVDRSGPVRSCDLAEQLRMTPSTLSRNLKPLVSAGLLAFEPGDDARSHCVVLTAQGRTVLARARKHWRVAQESLAEQLGVDRVEALHALIDESLQLLGGRSAGKSAKARATTPHPIVPR